MKFTKLGIIVGIFYWTTERIWENPDLLWPLALLGLGGAAIGALIDFIIPSKKSRPSPHSAAQNDIKAKKRAYMEKLKEKKAAKDDPDCF